jgi:hypothetical protein
MIPSSLMYEVCSVIMDTGYIGSAEDYVKEFYNKDFSELTVCEAEMIVRTLGSKPGCLYEGKGDLGLMPEEKEDATN